MTVENNKSIVQKALSGLIETRDVEGLAPFLSEDFRHHRADSGTSTKGEWLAAVGAALIPLADMRVEVLQMLADGDRVVVHSRRRLPGGGPEIAVVEIWRIDDGLIAEGWEVVEPVSRVADNQVWWLAT